MEYGSVRGLEKPVSRLVLGSVIKPREDPGPWFELADRAMELGINSFDTAHEYAAGYADTVLGQWMESRRNRERVVILAKGAHHNEVRKRVTAFDIASDLFDSLARMKTDYVDMFLLHRDDPALPVGPIVEALHSHWEAGRIKAYGGSNWSWRRMADANDYALSHGLQPFTASSQHFSLAEQLRDPWGGGCVSLAGAAQEDGRRWHRENAIPVFAYASLSGGLLSGRVTRDNYTELERQGTIDEACVRAYCHPVNFDRVERASRLAAAKNLPLPVIALSFVLLQAERGALDAHALVGAMNPRELEVDALASGKLLSPEEAEWLDTGAGGEGAAKGRV